MNILSLLKLCFISISLISLVLAIIFRFNYRRRLADILELIAYAFLAVFTAQYVSWNNASSYTNINSIASLILFVVSVTLVVYKIVLVIQRK